MYEQITNHYFISRERPTTNAWPAPVWSLMCRDTGTRHPRAPSDLWMCRTGVHVGESRLERAISSNHVCSGGASRREAWALNNAFKRWYTCS